MLSTRPERLQAKYDYTPETGVLTHRKNTRGNRAGDSVGCLDSYGYLVTSFEGKTCKVHRLIWELVFGFEPDTIDHIDRNKTNNRITNLRSIPIEDNVRNRGCVVIDSNGYSIKKHKATTKWAVTLVFKDGYRAHLGLFYTYEEAAAFVATAPTSRRPWKWNGTSGVCFHKGANKWMAAVPAAAGGGHIGYFENKEQALSAVATRLREMGGT